MAGGGIYYLYGKMLDRLTSAHPRNVEFASYSRDRVQIARLTLDRFQAALSDNRQDTIEFTAGDLNALVAEHPDFAHARGRVYFTIADSSMTLDLSVPLDHVPFPRLRGRWFNGKVRFSLNYEYDQFSFGSMLVESGRWRIPNWLLSPTFASSFSRSFSNNFNQSLSRNPAGAVFWKHIKSIVVQGDNLIVTTQKVVD